MCCTPVSMVHWEGGLHNNQLYGISFFGGRKSAARCSKPRPTVLPFPALCINLFISFLLSFIPPSLGIIMTAVADLDRETQDRYELVVKATDMAGQMGGLSGSTTVTIVITDVNDNPPRFTQSESATPPPAHSYPVIPPETKCKGSASPGMGKMARWKEVRNEKVCVAEKYN